MKSVVNAHVQTLDFGELMERAKSQLSLTDYYEYDYMGYLIDPVVDYVCLVEITKGNMA